MKVAESKTTSTHSLNHQSKASSAFFNTERTSSLLAKGKSDSIPFFQPKLTIGQPNDKYEKEADAVADAVVNQTTAQPVLQAKNISTIQRYMTNAEFEERGTNTERMEEDKRIQEKPEVNAPPQKTLIQRMCADCEGEENIQRMSEEEDMVQEKPILQQKPIFESKEDSNSTEVQRKCAACEQEEGAIQPKAVGGGEMTASSSLQSRLNSSKGGGSPLPDNTRTSMESSIGADFSGVRVHTDSRAVQMNKELGAQAFTHGSNVYFNSGKYDTSGKEGRRLLGHELTHVVQQMGKNHQTITQKPTKPMLMGDWIIKSRAIQNPLVPGGKTDAELLEDAFKEICPFTFRQGDRIKLGSSHTLSNRPEGCSCISDIENEIGIAISQNPEVEVVPHGWSSTGFGARGTIGVSVRHPDDPFQWGYWTTTDATHPNERRFIKPFKQTLAHEVCGHAATFARTRGARTGGRGTGTGHNEAIIGENRIATEQGVASHNLRGLDMHQGTSIPMPGHRGESFLAAIIPGFQHGSHANPGTIQGVLDSIVNTIRGFTNLRSRSRSIKIQVEGFAFANEGGIVLAHQRADTARAAIIATLTTKNINIAGRILGNLAAISPGNSIPKSSQSGRMVRVYLFHNQNSAVVPPISSPAPVATPNSSQSPPALPSRNP